MTAWAGSNRRAELPRNWTTITRRILQRDPHCKLGYATCTLISTEVDHIGDKHNHTDTNLRGVCHNCHQQRTQRQSQDARGVGLSRLRPPEAHPALRT